MDRQINAEEVFNCKDLTYFIDSIVQILPFKGMSMSRFYMCEIRDIRFLTKLCFYRKTSPEIYGTKTTQYAVSHTDAEIHILKVFKRELIDKNITPCILELVYYRICHGVAKVTPKAKVCERLMLEYKEVSPDEDVPQLICKYNDLVKNNLAHDKYAYLVLEKCDIVFDEFIKKSLNTPVSHAIFKALIFQIIYTLYAIHVIYPGFRHYDLHTENIMLKFDTGYKFETTNPQFVVFFIEGIAYNIPYFGIIPKIIDFGFSSLPEKKIISNAVDDKLQMYYRSENDLLFLFYWIHQALVQSDSDKSGKIKSILAALEPNRTYIHYYTEYIRKVEPMLPTYEMMIKNDVFDEYRQYTIPDSQIYASYAPVK